MALTEKQTLMDIESKNLGYDIKTDSDLRFMIRELRKRIDFFEENKSEIISKEDEIKSEVLELNPDDFKLENNLIIEQENTSYNNKTMSELETYLKDEYYDGHLKQCEYRIEKTNKNLEIILGELELRLEDVVDRTIQGGY